MVVHGGLFGLDRVLSESHYQLHLKVSGMVI